MAKLPWKVCHVFRLKSTIANHMKMSYRAIAVYGGWQKRMIKFAMAKTYIQNCRGKNAYSKLMWDFYQNCRVCKNNNSNRTWHLKFMRHGKCSLWGMANSTLFIATIFHFKEIVDMAIIISIQRIGMVYQNEYSKNAHKNTNVKKLPWNNSLNFAMSKYRVKIAIIYKLKFSMFFMINLPCM